MRKTLKALVCVLLILTLVSQSAGNVPALAGSEVNVYMNGTKMVFEVPAQIIDGRTMVPLRAIFEAMGAAVAWDDATRTATGTLGDTVVVLPIGSLYPTINGGRRPTRRPGTDRERADARSAPVCRRGVRRQRHLGRRDAQRVYHDRRRGRDGGT
jgi:hypothetical protein